MEIPTMLLRRVLLDVRSQQSDSIDRDYEVIHSRYEKEGMSFLTITLPTLDDALLKGLANGRLERCDFMGFKPFCRRGSLPALLSGFFRRIFHDDGALRAEPDVCAIFAIRQVTRLFKKVELPCSEQRIKAAYERYISNDSEVDWRCHRNPYNSVLFDSVAGYLWAELEMLSGRLYRFPGIFGPGATAERVNRNERYTIKQWPERAEKSFPSSFFASHREDFGSCDTISYLPVEKEQPVRVVQVPKTLKTPRTISVEPSYMMLMQQSIAKPLMVYLESQRFGFQSIRFVDQSVNKALARQGSLDGSLATIDLKDASDMVDLDLVRRIFGGPCPTFLQLIEDCRSTKALLPDGTHLPLRKFASMGSALCFPVEAMVFFTIIMYALVEKSGKVPSRRLLRQLAKDVAVYGDDIIVPSSMAPVVMEKLEDFGLKVNHNKSFHTGLFRESCGGDYYAGVDITPAYVRQWDVTGTLSNASHKVAYVALSNTFYMKGLWNACQYLRDGISLRISTTIPLSQHPIGCLHFTSLVRSSNLCYDSRVHGYRVKGLGIRSAKDADHPSDMAGFLGLAFGNRYFSDSIEEFKNTVCQEPPARFITADAWSSGTHKRVYGRFMRSCMDGDVGSEIQETIQDYGCEIPQSQLPPDLDGEKACESMLNLSYGVSGLYDGSSLYKGTNFPSRVFSGLRENLSHLNHAIGRSLYTSDKPHALSLKRAWTASQAGLNW